MKILLNTLYVQSQGSYLRLDHETLKIEVEKQMMLQVPLHHLGAVVVFGNVLCSPFLIHRCAEDGRDLVWLSEHGQFQGRLSGRTTGNVLLRRSQHSTLDQGERNLAVARHFVAGKLQNARQVLMRSAREAKSATDQQLLSEAAKIHAEAIKTVESTSDLDKLRGTEGFAAKSYFGAFTAMIRTEREFFAFTERSRRPPRDPINALLSFIYTLLVNECVAACEGVGLGPQIGFLHALRGWYGYWLFGSAGQGWP